MPLTSISSPDNSKLKMAKKVRGGKIRDLIFIEGKRLVQEALSSAVEIEYAILTEAFVKTPAGEDLADELVEREVDVLLVPAKLFKTFAATESPQGVVVLGRRPATGPPKSLQGKLDLCVLLFEVNNPSNLGAILRTAEASGVSCVITSARSADIFSPKTLRASMGSAFRLRLWDNADPEEVFEWARGKGMLIAAADVRSSKPFTEINWALPRLLVFGSEAAGLPDSLFEQTDERIIIPIEKPVESLNLAVACGVILFEARRQITAAPCPPEPE